MEIFRQKPLPRRTALRHPRTGTAVDRQILRLVAVRLVAVFTATAVRRGSAAGSVEKNVFGSQRQPPSVADGGARRDGGRRLPGAGQVQGLELGGGKTHLDKRLIRLGKNPRIFYWSLLLVLRRAICHKEVEKF